MSRSSAMGDCAPIVPGMELAPAERAKALSPILAEFEDNAPKVRGRIVTTISKAKEVRPLIEKCITIARRSLAAADAAAEHESSAERGSQEWKSWRSSDKWQAWNQAIAPAVAARRRCVKLLGNKQAVEILFDDIAPRFADRPGGYTRIVRLAQPRLGDAGQQAILEFVGVRDRVVQKSEKPAFEDPAFEDTEADQPEDEAAETAEVTESEATEAENDADDAEQGDETAEKQAD